MAKTSEKRQLKMKGGSIKRLLIGIAVSGLVFVPFAPTGWTEESKNGTVTGELVDTACYLKINAKGMGHQKCAIKCAKSGIPVGVLDEKSGKVYTIAVAAGALADSMAMTARVTGDIFEGSHVIAPEKVEAKGTDGNWKAVSLPEH